MSHRTRPGRSPLNQLVDELLCAVFGHHDIHVPGRPTLCVHCGRTAGAARRRSLRGGNR